MVNFSSVKYDGAKVTLSFTDEAGDDFTVVSSTAPAPDFIQAFEGLAPHLADLCEVDGSQNVTVRTVHFKKKGKLDAFIISGTRQLQRGNKKMLLNTPLFVSPEEDEDEDESSGYLPAAARDAINKLEAAASNFVNGKRSRDLFNQDEAPEVSQDGIAAIKAQADVESEDPAIDQAEYGHDEAAAAGW